MEELTRLTENSSAGDNVDQEPMALEHFEPAVYKAPERICIEEIPLQDLFRQDKTGLDSWINSQNPFGPDAEAPVPGTVAPCEPQIHFELGSTAWCESVLRMKWSSKARAIEELMSHLCKTAESDLETMVRFAVKILDDSNSNVSLLGVRLIDLLAETFLSQFPDCASQIIEPIMAKLKEKKPVALRQVKATLDKLLVIAGFEPFYELFGEALKQQNPGFKQATLAYIEEVLCKLDRATLNRSSVSLARTLIFATDDSNGGVRDAALKCLKIYYDAKLCRQMIDQLPPAKLIKINESASLPAEPETTHTVLKSSEKKPARALPPQANSKAPSKPTPIEPVHQELSSVELEGKLVTYMPEDLYVCCLKSDWKLRIEGLTCFADWVMLNQELVRANAQDLLLYLKQVSNDWKENNIKVLQALFQAITAVVASGGSSNLQGFLTAQAVEKLSEVKASSADCVRSLCRFVGAREVVRHFTHALKTQKKPKAKSSGLGFLVLIIEEFGIKCLPLPEIVDVAKQTFSIVNPQVKASAEELLASIYSYIGNKIMPLLSGLKEAQVKALQTKFSTVLVKDVPADVAETTAPTADKTMLSAKVNSKILKELDDANWKVRKSALDRIHTLVRESGHANSEGLGPLIKALLRRLNDPNKSLVRNCITLIGDLAVTLGQEAKSCFKGLATGLLDCLTDKQALLRQDALNALDQWAGAIGLGKLMGCVSISLTKDSTELIEDLLAWLVERKENLTAADAKTLIPSVIHLLQNKSQTIRKSAEDFFAFLVMRSKEVNIEPYLKALSIATAAPIRAIAKKYIQEPEPSMELEASVIPLQEIVLSRQPSAVTRQPVTATETTRFSECSEADLLRMLNEAQPLDCDVLRRVMKQALSSSFFGIMNGSEAIACKLLTETAKSYMLNEAELTLLLLWAKAKLQETPSSTMVTFVCSLIGYLSPSNLRELVLYEVVGVVLSKDRTLGRTAWRTVKDIVSTDEAVSRMLKACEGQGMTDDVKAVVLNELDSEVRKRGCVKSNFAPLTAILEVAQGRLKEQALQLLKSLKAQSGLSYESLLHDPSNELLECIHSSLEVVPTPVRTRAAALQSSRGTVQDMSIGLLSSDTEVVFESLLGIAQWAKNSGEFTAYQTLEVTESWLKLLSTHSDRQKSPIFQGLTKTMLLLAQNTSFVCSLDKALLVQLFRALIGSMNRLILAVHSVADENLLNYLDFSLLTLLDSCNINTLFEVLCELSIEAIAKRDLSAVQVVTNCTRKLVDILPSVSSQINIEEILNAFSREAECVEDNEEVSEVVKAFLMVSLEKINRFFGTKPLLVITGKLRAMAAKLELIRADTPLPINERDFGKTYEESQARLQSILKRRAQDQVKLIPSLTDLSSKVSSLGKPAS